MYLVGLANKPLRPVGQSPRDLEKKQKQTKLILETYPTALYGLVAFLKTHIREPRDKPTLRH